MRIANMLNSDVQCISTLKSYFLSKKENGYMLGGDFGDVQLVGGEIGFEIHT